MEQNVIRLLHDRWSLCCQADLAAASLLFPYHNILATIDPPPEKYAIEKLVFLT